MQSQLCYLSSLHQGRVPSIVVQSVYRREQSGCDQENISCPFRNSCGTTSQNASEGYNSVSFGSSSKWIVWATQHRWVGHWRILACALLLQDTDDEGISPVVSVKNYLSYYIHRVWLPPLYLAVAWASGREQIQSRSSRPFSADDIEYQIDCSCQHE